MPEMTLSEAAAWAGKGRPAILKAIQKGRLSAMKDDTGQWRIDPAELARVYQPGTGLDGSSLVPRSMLDTSEATTAKDRELALLREMLDEVRRERDDVRQDRDRWREQAEMQTRLLTHQRAQEAPTQPPAVIPGVPGKRPGLLARIVAAMRS